MQHFNVDLRGSWDNVTGHNAPLYTNKYDVNPKLTVVSFLFYFSD